MIGPWVVERISIKLFIKGLFIISMIFILRRIREQYHIHTMEDLQLFTQQYTDPVTLSLAFVAVTLVASLCFVPISLFKAFAGIYFGFFYGVVIAFSAALISAAFSFLFARIIGKEGVEALYQKKLVQRLSEKQRGWMEKTRNPNFLHIFFLRNLYFIPFTPMNYLLGVSKVSFATYLGATIAGMLPGTLSYIYFFSQSLSIREDPLSLWPMAVGMPLYYYLLWKIRKKAVSGGQLLRPSVRSVRPDSFDSDESLDKERVIHYS